MTGEPNIPSQTEFAVIDLGSTSIRMAIAQADGRGGVQLLDSLHQDVNLGRDTFSSGTIRPATMEACVRTLRSYAALLDQYRISDPSRIRAVATSAVREARNRLAFLDRVYMATGIQVEIADEADVSRLMYYSIAPQIHAHRKRLARDTVAVEIAGGSTELMHLREGKVQYSHTYRLGSYRMRRLLDSDLAAVSTRRSLVESQVLRTLEQMALDFQVSGTPSLVVMGGEPRFVAKQMGVKAKGADELIRISLRNWQKITESVLELPVDEIAEHYHITYPSAEVLGPALLSYLMTAQHLGVRELFISGRTMRDGLIAETMGGGKFSQKIREHVMRAALELGRKYHFHEGHARYVAGISMQIFGALADEHRMDERFGFLLEVSALLHEIGYFVSNQSHHKHSMYLIRNSEIFGLGARDLLLVSLVARYHRRTAPKASHEAFGSLSMDDRIRVMQMAAILRLADAMDRTHSQRHRDLQFEKTPGRFTIFAEKSEDLALERISLREKGSLFEEVYGLKPVIRKARE